MLILIKKEQLPLDEIIYADMGDWMWPGIGEHFSKMEEYIGIPIFHINISDLIKKDFKKYGFPSYLTRWCTAHKRVGINNYLKKYDNKVVQYIGIAADEDHRFKKKIKHEGFIRYPLAEYGYTQKMAFELSKKEGFDFGGIYEHRERFNCWCCPLQRLDELRIIFKHYPELWDKLRKMQWESPNDFRKDETIFSIEHRWWKELHDPKLKKKWDKI